MKSKSALDAKTFDLPEPTLEDLAALERAGSGTTMTADQYLDFLLAVTKDLPPSREIDDPWPEPFRL